MNETFSFLLLELFRASENRDTTDLAVVLSSPVSPVSPLHKKRNGSGFCSLPPEIQGQNTRSVPYFDKLVLTGGLLVLVWFCLVERRKLSLEASSKFLSVLLFLLLMGTAFVLFKPPLRAFVILKGQGTVLKADLNYSAV